MAQVASTQQFPFVWEGTDKKGKRLKGKMLAVSEAAVKADLRRQGVLQEPHLHRPHGHRPDDVVDPPGLRPDREPADDHQLRDLVGDGRERHQGRQGR